MQEAISLLQSTIEPKQDRYGDLSPEVARTWKIIGTSYLSMGKSEKALAALKKVKVTPVVDGCGSLVCSRRCSWQQRPVCSRWT